MWITNNEFIIRCECGEVFHPIYLHLETWRFDDNSPFRALEIQMNVDDDGFLGRIKKVFYYLFKNRKFWHNGNITMQLDTPKQQKQLKELIEFLKKGLTKE